MPANTVVCLNHRDKVVLFVDQDFAAVVANELISRINKEKTIFDLRRKSPCPVCKTVAIFLMRSGDG